MTAACAAHPDPQPRAADAVWTALIPAPNQARAPGTAVPQRWRTREERGCRWGSVRWPGRGEGRRGRQGRAHMAVGRRPPACSSPQRHHLQARLHVVGVQHNSHTQEVHHRCLWQGGAARSESIHAHQVAALQPVLSFSLLRALCRPGCLQVDPTPWNPEFWQGPMVPSQASQRFTCVRASSSGNASAVW